MYSINISGTRNKQQEMTPAVESAVIMDRVGPEAMGRIVKLHIGAQHYPRNHSFNAAGRPITNAVFRISVPHASTI